VVKNVLEDVELVRLEELHRDTRGSRTVESGADDLTHGLVDLCEAHSRDVLRVEEAGLNVGGVVELAVDPNPTQLHHGLFEGICNRVWCNRRDVLVERLGKKRIEADGENGLVLLHELDELREEEFHELGV